MKDLFSSVTVLPPDKPIQPNLSERCVGSLDFWSGGKPVLLPPGASTIKLNGRN